MKNSIDSNFALAILALVAACVGFAFWTNTSSQEISTDVSTSSKDLAQKIKEKTTQPNDNTNIDLGSMDMCETNQECIVVQHNHCCGSTKKAINAGYLEVYESREDLQSFQDESECALIGQCPNDAHITQATCENNRCVLVR